MKTYREYQPRQSFLLPPSPLDWLPAEHLAYFILETVAQLDLSAIRAYYERERRGFPPHDPRMMTALLLYAYCVGLPSSRKIEQRTHEDIAFRVLAGNTHPDHSCISEFRRIHLDALSALFVQVLKMCQRMGLVKLGVVALDGTKLKANASKHKAMSLVSNCAGHVFRHRCANRQVTIRQIAHFVHEPQNGLLGVVPVCFCRQALAFRLDPSMGLIAVIDPSQTCQCDQGSETENEDEYDLEVDAGIGFVETLRQLVDALQQFIRVLENRDP